MIDVQAIDQQCVLRLDDIDMAVTGKLCMQAVARLLDPPRPMPSGMTMKERVASSGWPSPNSTPASEGISKLRPVPVVPCSASTALVTCPAASVLGVPSVV